MLCLTSIHRKKYQSNTLNCLKALNSPLCEEYKSTIMATTSDFRHVVRKCGKREEVIVSVCTTRIAPMRVSRSVMYCVTR